ncbi:MAG: energy transducer TonB [Acidobacteriota bacterium]|nr:energy transducer TonB [Acidobacteriota bacterium]
MVTLFTLILIATNVTNAGAQERRAYRLIQVAELSLRKAATRIVMPEFPESAKKRGVKGLAVVEIEFDENGAVSKAVVLESPDRVIAEAVSHAVGQWKFQRQTLGGQPVHIRGKLTFYYVIDADGGGHVENPRQAR